MSDTTKKTSHPNTQADHDEVAAKRLKTDAGATNKAPAVAAGGVPSVPLPLANASPSILDLFFKTSVASVMPNLEGKLYTTVRQESVAACFKGLVDHSVTSCPVMTKDKVPKFFNFLEIWDVVEFVVHHFQNKGSLADSKNFWSLMQQEDAFNELVVNDITKYPTSRKRFDSLPLPMEYSLLFAAELMMREKNLHRLAVVDNVEKRSIKSVITQSRIVQFIYDHMEALGDRRHRTVSEFPAACFGNVLTINSKTQAIDAFTSMAKEGFTGLPVVDDEKKLLAVISMSDIKGIALDGSLFFRLYNPTWTFLDRLKVDYPGRPTAPVYCTPSDSLESVVRKMVEHKLHRLPIVNSKDDMIVAGIVTLRDVLRGALLPW